MMKTGKKYEIFITIVHIFHFMRELTGQMQPVNHVFETTAIQSAKDCNPTKHFKISFGYSFCKNNPLAFMKNYSK